MKSLIRRKLFKFCYLFVFFMFLNTGYSIAKDNSLARIKRIVLLKKPEPEIIEKNKETDRVLYHRGNKNWQNAMPDLKLNRNDEVMLKPNTKTQLIMNTPTGGARMTFWSDSLAAGRLPAAYRIEENPKKLGSYYLFMNYGSMVVDRIRDSIAVKSSALEFIAFNTRVYCRVDRETQETLVFLEKGKCNVMAQGDTVALKPMDVVSVVPGGAIQQLNWSVEKVSELQRVVSTQHTNFWQQFRPWWQQWYVVAPVVGAVGYGAYAIANGGNGKKNGSGANGKVIIKIP